MSRFRFLPMLLIAAAFMLSHAVAQEEAPPIRAVNRIARPVQEVQLKAQKPEVADPDDAADPAEKEKTDKPAKKEPEKAEVPEPKPDPVDPQMIRLFLMDGAVIAGKLSITEVAVETSYGNLSIPISSLKSFTPGLGSHPELLSKIDKSIESLGSPDFGERELAQKTILKIGLPAREALKRFADDRDTERRTRIKTILNELDEIKEEEDEGEEGKTFDRESMVQRDTVETTEFTLVGKIVPKSFSIASPYGPLTVKLSDIRRAQRSAEDKPDVKKTVTVEGTHLVQRGSMNTRIKVEKGDKITVDASGSITMTPWGNQAVTTPDGAPNYGWYVPNEIPSGALIGRLGEKGNFFKLGSRGTITATASGTLELAVAMQQDYAQNQFPGRFNVKIVVKRK